MVSSDRATTAVVGTGSFRSWSGHNPNSSKGRELPGQDGCWNGCSILEAAVAIASGRRAHVGRILPLAVEEASVVDTQDQAATDVRQPKLDVDQVVSKERPSRSRHPIARTSNHWKTMDVGDAGLGACRADPDATRFRPPLRLKPADMRVSHGQPGTVSAGCGRKEWTSDPLIAQEPGGNIRVHPATVASPSFLAIGCKGC
jgi:hypothetical protein